jgi:hypothetical protein
MPARNGAPAADSSGGDEPRPYEPRGFRMDTNYYSEQVFKMSLWTTARSAEPGFLFDQQNL